MSFCEEKFVGRHCLTQVEETNKVWCKRQNNKIFMEGKTNKEVVDKFEQKHFANRITIVQAGDKLKQCNFPQIACHDHFGIAR